MVRAGLGLARGRLAHVRKRAATARALCGEEAQQARLPRARAGGPQLARCSRSRCYGVRAAGAARAATAAAAAAAAVAREAFHIPFFAAFAHEPIFRRMVCGVVATFIVHHSTGFGFGSFCPWRPSPLLAPCKRRVSSVLVHLITMMQKSDV